MKNLPKKRKEFKQKILRESKNYKNLRTDIKLHK